MPSLKRARAKNPEAGFRKKHGMPFVSPSPKKPVQVPVKDKVRTTQRHVDRLDKTSDKMLARTDREIMEVRRTPGLKGLWWSLTGEKNRRIIELQDRRERIHRKRETLTRPRSKHITAEAGKRGNLWNRDALKEEMEKNLVHGENHSLLYLDLDHFKQFNDSYGHLAGDRMLHSLGEALNEVAEANKGFASRYGGEEFVIYFTKTGMNPRQTIKEIDRRLREKMKKDNELAGVPQRGIPTFSAGFTERKITRENREEYAETKGKKWTQLSGKGFKDFAHEQFASIINEADSSMYAAKRKGRNRLGLAEGKATVQIR